MKVPITICEFSHILLTNSYLSFSFKLLLLILQWNNFPYQLLMIFETYQLYFLLRAGIYILFILGIHFLAFLNLREWCNLHDIDTNKTELHAEILLRFRWLVLWATFLLRIAHCCVRMVRLLGPWSCPALNQMRSVFVPNVYIFESTDYKNFFCN